MIFVHFPAIADWKYEERIDAMTDKTNRTAIVNNDKGYEFSVYRPSGQTAVWGLFSLSDVMPGQIDWNNPPMYRVDKNDPVELETMKHLQELTARLGLPIQAYEWEPGWVNFRMWDGEHAGDRDPTKSVNLITELMEGNKVIFRYYLSTGGYKETTFTLNGAATAIAKALGVSSDIDHAAQHKSEQIKNAALEESKKCEQELKRLHDPDKFTSCTRKIDECRKKSNDDVHKFVSCMQ